MTLENTDLSRRKLLRTTAIGVPAAGVVALGANLVMAPAANAETDLGAKMKVESEKLQEKAQRAKELADSFDLDAAAFDDPALEAAVKDISGQLHDAAQKAETLAQQRAQLFASNCVKKRDWGSLTFDLCQDRFKPFISLS